MTSCPPHSAVNPAVLFKPGLPWEKWLGTSPSCSSARHLCLLLIGFCSACRKTTSSSSRARCRFQHRRGGSLARETLLGIAEQPEADRHLPPPALQARPAAPGPAELHPGAPFTLLMPFPMVCSTRPGRGGEQVSLSPMLPSSALSPGEAAPDAPWEDFRHEELAPAGQPLVTGGLDFSTRRPIPRQQRALLARRDLGRFP